MKQYLNVLRQIMEHGHDHGDRTGVGRRSVFATQERFNLQEGFPLVTTRKIFTKGIIEELLWFIRGSTDNKELTDKKVNIWNQWALSEHDIEIFADKYSEGNPDFRAALVTKMSTKLNGIGPMYGHVWRNAPNDKIHILWPDVKLDNIPHDKLLQYNEEYNKLSAEHNPIEGPLPSYEEFCKMRYYSTIDQLNELVIGLKVRPFSSRHIVTAWVPQITPFEGLSPQENIMLERGALAACHMMFQCFVTPGEEGEKNKLSLQVYIR
jgi:thymidylate synthase